MSSSVRKSPIAVLAFVGLLAAVLVLGRPHVARGQDAPSEPGGFGCMEMGQPCDPLAVPDAPVPPVNASVDLDHAKATFDGLCVGCHGIEVVSGSPRSRDAWWTAVQAMKQYGMQASDAQQAEVLEYLAARYHS